MGTEATRASTKTTKSPRDLKLLPGLKGKNCQWKSEPCSMQWHLELGKLFEQWQ